MELVVYLKTKEDLAVLEPLLQRLRLRYERRNGNEPTTAVKGKIELAKQQIDVLREAGVDVKGYGDPVEWQREIRNDEPEGFRD